MRKNSLVTSINSGFAREVVADEAAKANLGIPVKFFEYYFMRPHLRLALLNANLVAFSYMRILNKKLDQA
jgi:hypothetical protein